MRPLDRGTTKRGQRNQPRKVGDGSYVQGSVVSGLNDQTYPGTADAVGALQCNVLGLGARSVSLVCGYEICRATSRKFLVVASTRPATGSL